MPERFAVILKPQAVQDIYSISDYIAERSQDLDVALHWEESIHSHIARLEYFPSGYSHFVIEPYRKMLHGQYLILFRIEEVESRVIVCRVIHAGRLPENTGPVE